MYWNGYSNSSRLITAGPFGSVEYTCVTYPIVAIMGWPAGTSIDSQDTLSFSVLSGVRSMNEVFPLERAPDAYEHMMSGRAQFRVVLTTGQ
jgi:D-arabinose 1-dehydrogenase-like Zn-dependent alcohol dehydrogenase